MPKVSRPAAAPAASPSGKPVTWEDVLAAIDEDDITEADVAKWAKVLESLPALNDHGDDVDSNLLSAAAARGRRYWMKALGAAGADIPERIEDEDGHPVLVMMRKNLPKDLSVLKEVLQQFDEEPPVDVAAPTSDITPLAYAIEELDEDFASFLLSAGAHAGELRDLINTCDDPFADELPLYARVRLTNGSDEDTTMVMDLIASKIKDAILKPHAVLAAAFHDLEVKQLDEATEMELKEKIIQIHEKYEARVMAIVDDN